MSRPPNVRCENCVYLHVTSPEEAIAQQKLMGECRVHAPRMPADPEKIGAAWPKVYGPFWCGEFDDEWDDDDEPETTELPPLPLLG